MCSFILFYLHVAMLQSNGVSRLPNCSPKSALESRFLSARRTCCRPRRPRGGQRWRSWRRSRVESMPHSQNSRPYFWGDHLSGKQNSWTFLANPPREVNPKKQGVRPREGACLPRKSHESSLLGGSLFGSSSATLMERFPFLG